jgi:hypothetical protein
MVPSLKGSVSWAINLRYENINAYSKYQHGNFNISDLGDSYLTCHSQLQKENVKCTG